MSIYIGGLIEKVTANGVTDWRHYIYANGSPVAVVSRETDGGNSTYYMQEDNLGSVSKITNGSAATSVSESFGAFGARRDATDWSGALSSSGETTIANLSRRGFTGPANSDQGTRR